MRIRYSSKVALWIKLLNAILLLNLALIAGYPTQLHAAVPGSAAKQVVRTVNKLPYSIFRKAESSIAKISTVDGTLSDRSIRELLTQSKELGGTAKVGNTLSKLDEPGTFREEILEDAYLRLLIAQEHLSRSEAEEFFLNLENVPGFRSNLRKISGNNPFVSTGHLNELRLANSMTKNGFKVRGIAQPFNDPQKRGITDIDLIVERGNKILIFEAKDYAPSTRLPMDGFRADIGSLEQYQLAFPDQEVIPIFTLTNVPQNPLDLQSIISETTRRNVQLFIGSAEENTIQILQLLKAMNLP